MAYGTVKVDFITFDNGGADQTIPVSGIANTISGSITVTGLISGQTVAGVSGLFTTVTGNTVSAITVIGTTVVSGATVTGDNVNASTTVNAPTVNATTVNATTISGETITGGSASITGTVSGNQLQGVSGVFTNVTGTTVNAVTLSGATITGGNAGIQGTVTASGINATNVSGTNIFGTVVSGSTITGDNVYVLNTITGNTIRALSISGNTITGSTVSGTNVFGTVVSGTTIRGNNAYVVNTITGNTISALLVSGNTITGNAVNGTNIFGTVISGTTITGTTVNAVNVYASVVTGAVISGGTITGLSIKGAVLSGDTITGASAGIAGTITAGRVNATFVSGTSISGAVVSGAMIIGENIYISGEVVGNTVSGVTVLGTTLSGASVLGTTLSGVTLLGTTLSGVSVLGTTLSGVSVIGTGIQGVTVSGTTTVAGGSLVPLEPAVPNVGIYLPASNTLGFATSGVDQLQINSQGYINASNLPSSGIALNIRRNLSGNTTTAGISSVCFNTATTAANTYGVYSFITPTPSGSLASPNVHIYYAAGDSGSAYTTPAAQYGYYADNSITQGLSNFGFFSAIPSGTNRYGFYEASGATSVFLGNVGIGTGTPTAQLEVSGDTKLVGDVQVSSVNRGPLAGFRNAIINGNFDFWQRGTSQTALGYGSADRWHSTFVGSACTLSREPFTLGQTSVPGEPTYFCRAVVSSVAGASNYVFLQHRVESVRTFAGQEVTLSFWAKADASKNIAVEFVQVFGNGGSFSAAVQEIGVTKASLTTSWQKITVTATMPSIAGKTLGTDGDDSLRFNIWFDAGSDSNSRTDTLGQQSGTFDIAQVQLEPGPVATVFERRPLGVELALCQRYFIGYPTGTAAADLNELLGIGSSYPVQSGASSTRYKLSNVTWPTTMRATPVVTWSPTEVYSNCTDFIVAASKFGCRSSALSVSTGPMYVTLAIGSISIDAEL